MTHRGYDIGPASRELPDLPPDLLGDDAEGFHDVPRRRRRPTRPPFRPQHDAPSEDAPMTDVVTNVTTRDEDWAAAESGERVPLMERVIDAVAALPGPLAVARHGVPNTVMALSIASVFLLGSVTALGIPIWAAALFVPSVLLVLLSRTPARHAWRQAALINLATMGIVFPVLVVRQSVVRIPFMDGGTGTLLPPLIATVAVVALLAALGLACAVLSQEDPEYSGIIFLPAAMMVPLLAGQSDLVSLTSGLLIALSIFTVSAILTIVATMLPPAYVTIVTPVTIAIEFIALTLFYSATIFPTGSGVAGKVLFCIVVVATVGVAILAPIASVWIRQVTRIARAQAAQTSS